MTNEGGGGLCVIHPAAPRRKQMDQDLKGIQGGFQITHCCILGALLESRFDFRPFLLRVRGQSSPDASPLWRITTNEEWKVGRMTKPSRKPSRYDREKPYHFEVRMKL